MSARDTSHPGSIGLFLLTALVLALLGYLTQESNPEPGPSTPAATSTPIGPDTWPTGEGDARAELDTLRVAAHDIAPYDRDSDFGGWARTDSGCTTRQDVLRRDATDWVGDGCQPEALVVQDRYSGQAVVALAAGSIHIDHVVSVYDAWLTGAQDWTREERVAFYNDQANLVAVEDRLNTSKADSNAAQWMPPYEGGHCDFAARMVSVKATWDLAVTDAEYEALADTLDNCPGQGLVGSDQPPTFDPFPYLTGEGDLPAPPNPAPVRP